MNNRVGFIGSTDANTIMKGEWYDLWLIKTARAEPEDLSNVLPVQLGIWTEKFNVSWFDTQMNRITTDEQSHFIETIDGIRCETKIDGLVYDGLLECKHTNAFTNMEEQLQKYMPQLQFNMKIAKQKQCYLSVIFGNLKWECVCVGFDQDYFDNMMEKIKTFWQHVIDDVEPMDRKSESVNTDSILIDSMVRRDASKDNQFISLATDYIDHQESAKTFDKAKKKLKALVQPNEREVYSPILSIKRSKSGSLLFKAGESK